jgi:2-polyprenyl-3-methyl-5-hydroxy-6-metoxy-1,4-benzoquinol methylase
MFKRLREYLERAKDQLDQIAETSVANGHRLNHLSWQVDVLSREMKLLMGQLSLPPTELWTGRPAWTEGAPAAIAFPNSTLCRQDSFETAYFPYWTRRVGATLCYHRKLWEHVFICQALWERGAIRPGARGLGFGVGRETMAAFFASEDCRIVATDVEAEAAVRDGWSQTAQHAASLDALRYDDICEPGAFERNVTFRTCDMNDVPGDLTDFDFCWSACALEHLGSIEHGLRFIERSVECLRPGGWAVHTTEFNVSSNDHTVSEGGTVLFRRRDMEALAGRLAAKGHHVAPFDFNPGLAPLDRYIDVPPYRAEPHLKLAIQGYGTTSLGLIVQRGGG